MTALFALIRKDLLLYRDNRRALMLNVVMPILLAAFFGSLFGGSGSSTPGKVDVGLVQQDQSEVGRKIAAGLKADANLRVTELSLADAQAQVRKGQLPAAVVIPAGFGEQAGAALFSGRDKPQVPVFYDPSQAVVLAMVKGLLTQQVMQSVTADMFSGGGSRKYINQSLERLRTHPLADATQGAQLTTFLGSLKTYLDQNAVAAPSADGAAAAASASTASATAASVDASSRAAPSSPAPQDASATAAASSAPAPHTGGGLTMPYTTQDQALSSGPKYNGYAHSFAGMSVQFILFMGIDMGIGVLLAQRTGIWNRQLAAPVTLTTVLLARAVSGTLIALGLLCVIFLAAVLFFKVPITNPLGFVGVALCFAAMTSGFGLFIAAFGRTPEAARGMAVFATLILVMLGGAWVPSFVFPQWMQSATLLVPTRWAVDGFDAMTWRGLGFDAALKSMAVQLGFAAAFATLAIAKFRRDQR